MQVIIKSPENFRQSFKNFETQFYDQLICRKAHKKCFELVDFLAEAQIVEFRFADDFQCRWLYKYFGQGMILESFLSSPVFELFMLDVLKALNFLANNIVLIFPRVLYLCCFILNGLTNTPEYINDVRYKFFKV